MLPEIPYFFIFGCRSTSHIDGILGAAINAVPHALLEFSRQTVADWQLAYETRRRTHPERANEQEASNEKLVRPGNEYFPGEYVLVHLPYTQTTN